MEKTYWVSVLNEETGRNVGVCMVTADDAGGAVMKTKDIGELGDSEGLDFVVWDLDVLGTDKETVEMNTFYTPEELHEHRNRPSPGMY
jgi:hypothetical protein